MMRRMSSSLHERIAAVVPELQGWCTVEKACRLADLILETGPSLVVESGVFGGRSLIPQAMALAEQRYGVIVGIDPWTPEAALEGDVGEANAEWWGSKVNLEDIYVGFIEQVLKHRLTPHCSWVRRKSHEVTALFADESIDVFHQDSNHSELVSCREVTSWRGKLKPQGTWILDDCDWPTQKRAVELIQESGFRVVEDHTTWMIFRR
jgi:hypothetical protein